MRQMELAQAMRDEGNVPGALLRVNEAIELDPENARALLLRAYLRLESPRPMTRDRAEDLGLAEQDARKALALARQHDQAALVPQAENVLGGVLIEQGRPAEAVPVLESAAANPVNTSPHTAWGTLGRARQLAGDDAGAVEALEQAVRSERRFCLGYFWLGEVHFGAARFEEAEAALTLALEADARCGSFQDALRLRGETRARLGHRDDALRDFERCVELGARTEAGRACARFLSEAR